MNFEDTPQEAAFRARAKSFVAAHAPKQFEAGLRKASFGTSPIKSADFVRTAKTWQKTKADGGWTCLQWPKEYGGQGASAAEAVIWSQEEGIYSGISGGLFTVGQGMCGPTLLHWASDVYKRRYLPPLASGEEIWCQLFSEPAAGSDLAGLRTRAEPAADGSGDWIVNGQKIWTSYAHYADYGMLLARTDPGVPKHKGLTMFFLDMKSPGVEVRPIRQANGGAEFNEVFFADVRIPAAQMLGAVGQGWIVSLTTLMNERLSVGAVLPTGFPELFEYCAELTTDDGPVLDDPRVRSRLAQFAVRDSGLRYTGMRALSAVLSGSTPGPENSISKLVTASLLQEITAFAVDLQGEAGAIAKGDTASAAGRFQALLMRAPAMRIEGGSDEILRNIIAERVLGLPGDIRLDKDMPFKDIPRSFRAKQG